ncbi:DUF4876 domain-containing protein [Myroides marinus]|uniref:DUF4876 domain-containing protein n=1 Tax=Myroides marinus TaxID=703342 RepID=UPI002578B60B|nr:DUF4876 domain-containing protein [Myroides marinus]MDM1352362.1 DUF4876 domain-containing protein [Myroides marinus]MDM1359568.1 DUF4876 domain-containing protein [Myroides marinus]
MRNTLLLAIVFICTVFTTSCSKDDNSSDFANTLNVKFVAEVSQENTNLTIPLEGTSIEFTNRANGNKNTVTLDKQGIAAANLRVGSYNIIAKLTMTKQAYNQLIDSSNSKEEKIEEDSITFTANIDNLTVANAEDIKIVLKMNKASQSGLIFKQIFYAGSSLQDGSGYRDQFLEIYNNSEETLYVDGIVLAMLHNTTNSQATGPDDISYLPSRQYDWSKAAENSGKGDLNKDYVYAKKVLQFPGTGTQYPIEAGKSMIIASTAIDHTKNFIIGKPSEFVDPNKTVDLSKADFDVYILDYLQREYGIDITQAKYRYNLNTLGTAKMKVIKAQQSDLAMRFATDDGILLIQLPKDIAVESFPTVKAPKKNDSTQCVRIPVEYIIDGVQVRHSTDSRVAPRKVPESVDRGSAYAPNGTYSSQSLLRKTRYKLSNGRRVLQDTDNSTEDFVVLEKPVVSKGDDSFTN